MVSSTTADRYREESRWAGRGALSKAGLSAGFLALLWAVLAARDAPATGHELSVYGATPVEFWAGVGAAGAVALLAVWSPGTSRLVRSGGIGLSCASCVAVVSLPIVRGYYFAGGGDALTHLGWMRELLAGTLSPFELLYPAVHTTAVLFAAVLQLPVTLAAQYVVVLYVLVFLAFVPLAARAATGSQRAFAFGAFAALLLVPINNVSTHLMVHPATQAITFAPLVLYLLIVYVDAPGTRGDGLVGSVGALLTITGVATVLIHPQMAVSVLAVLVTVAAIQYVYRHRRPEHPIASHRPVYVQTATLVGAFLLWAPWKERVQAAARGVLENLLGASSTSVVSERSASLADLGSSLGTLFLKLFLASTVVALITGALMLATATRRLDGSRPRRNAVLVYLSGALVPLLALFGTFFVLDRVQGFRFLGFVMGVATITTAVALAMGQRSVETRLPRGAVRAASILLIAMLLVAAIPTAFSSPYVLKSSPQVTEAEMVGYGTAFEDRAEGVAFAGVRSGPTRYVDAYYGSSSQQALTFPGRENAIPEEAFNEDVTRAYDGRVYVPVTTGDIERETGLYDEYRYSRAGFERLDDHEQIDRVYTNGEFRLYHVRGDEEA
jgi:hypothetical protein